MPNTMPDMVSRPAVVKKSLLGCEWSRKVQKLKTTKFQNQAVPKPGGAARGGAYTIVNIFFVYTLQFADNWLIQTIELWNFGFYQKSYDNL